MPTLLEIALSNALVATGLAVLAAGVAWWWRRPALTHCLWLLVLLKLVTPPLIPISIPWPHAAEPEAAASTSQAQIAVPEAALASPPPPGSAPADATETVIIVVPETPTATPPPLPAPAQWPNVLVATWLIGSVLWFAWATGTVLRFRRLLRHAQPAPAPLQQTVRRLAERMGLRNVPGVSVVPGAVSPMVWFVGRAPRLLFPARLLENLDHEQRQTLLAHELAHVRRGDHRVRILELLVTGLYWWHPVVWWARREIHEAEEQCCDAWVVSTLDGAERTYALALLQAVAFVSKARAVLPAAASGIGQVPHLRRRLTMICQTKTPRSLSWAGWAAVGGVGLLLLPLLPIRAQDPSPDQPSSKQSKAEQQRIESAVRKALEYLDQEQHVKPAKVKGKAKNESKAVQQARAEVEKAHANVEAARATLKAAEAQFEQAQAHLAKLGGKPMAFKLRTFQFRPVEVTGQPQGKVWVWEGPHKGTPMQIQIGNAPAAKAGQVQQYRYRVITTTPGQHAGSVEEKLNQLQRELEELRKELKHQKPASGTQGQQFRFRVVPAAPAAGAGVPSAAPVPAPPAAGYAVPSTPAVPAIAAAPPVAPTPAPPVSVTPPPPIPVAPAAPAAAPSPPQPVPPRR